jgi:hypothetical protein
MRSLFLIAGIAAACASALAASTLAGPAAPRELALAGRLVAIAPATPGLPAAVTAEGAVVVREMEGCVLAVADANAFVRLARAGLRPEPLADLPSDRTFYALALSPESADFVEAHGRVLRRDAGEAVVEATPEEAEALAAGGVDLARVFLRPIRPPSPASPVRRHERDWGIRRAVDAVDPARIEAGAQRLQDFRTRYAAHDSCGAAAQWIAGELAACGVDSVSLHEWSGLWHENVVGVMRGRACPESVVVIGGHYDSITGFTEVCPGADDNASGVACMLECARVLGERRYRRSIAFVAFCAEELGLLGSEAYAHDAALRAEPIVAMINLDMVGYLAPGDVPDLTVFTNTASGWLVAALLEARNAYVGSVSFAPGSGGLPGGGTSDHASFWAQGYSAIFFFEDVPDYSPYIHTALDTVGRSFNSVVRARNAAQLVTALAAVLAVPDHGEIAAANGAHEVEHGPSLSAHPTRDGSVLTVRCDSPTIARLSLVDVTGRRVVALLRDERIEGTRSLSWDGRGGDGRAAADGIYFARLDAGDVVRTEKVLLRRGR